MNQDFVGFKTIKLYLILLNLVNDKRKEKFHPKKETELVKIYRFTTHIFHFQLFVRHTNNI